MENSQEINTCLNVLTLKGMDVNIDMVMNTDKVKVEAARFSPE